MAKDKIKPLAITEVVLRDAHQSILATRLRIEDMLPICEKLDQIGYWSIESWGGATFDACIRYLGEDPWERLRTLKKAMPKTPQQTSNLRNRIDGSCISSISYFIEFARLP